MSNQRLSLEDFGLGLMAGLISKSVDLVNEDRRTVHPAFIAAYKVLREELGEGAIGFELKADASGGKSSGVERILRLWKQGYLVPARTPGTFFFVMSPTDAQRRLARIPGGRELFLKATNAFLKVYRSR